jgi:uncharacterized Fe-S center protein
MNSKRQSSAFLLLVGISFITSAFSGCVTGKPDTAAAEKKTHVSTETAGAVNAFMTTDISPDGLIAVYEALGREASGKVAFKLHLGEPGGNNFLSPDLIKKFVQSLDGTIVESNTAGGIGRRGTAAMHLEVAKEHGFTAIAPVVILDEQGDIKLPVKNGRHLEDDMAGARFTDYDFHVVLTHFKGHAMGGFGGSVKNMSIGYASSNGKSYIHTGGTSRTTWGIPERYDDFLESMAEAAKAVADFSGENILYINIMNNLSIDCDCDGNPAAPEIYDIGILASLDPVALDKACVDLVYAAPGNQSMIERIESRNGIRTLDYAEEIGLGSQKYQLVRLNG